MSTCLPDRDATYVDTPLLPDLSLPAAPFWPLTASISSGGYGANNQGDSYSRQVSDLAAWPPTGRQHPLTCSTCPDFSPFDAPSPRHLVQNQMGADFTSNARPESSDAQRTNYDAAYTGSGTGTSTPAYRQEDGELSGRIFPPQKKTGAEHVPLRSICAPPLYLARVLSPMVVQSFYVQSSSFCPSRFKTATAARLSAAPPANWATADVNPLGRVRRKVVVVRAV